MYNASLCVYRFVLKNVIVRDTCTVIEKTLSPNLIELFKENGDTCINLPIQTHSITSGLIEGMFMAVWTFAIPENQCFMLIFLLRRFGDSDVLKILDGEKVDTVVMNPGITLPYTYPRQNETTTISVVYFHTSLDQPVYWRMAPSLNCYECWQVFTQGETIKIKQSIIICTSKLYA